MNRNKKRPLTKKEISEYIENLADLSDLSGCDSDDDPCYDTFIVSPAESFINAPESNIIEMRLEQMMGIEDNVCDEIVEEDNFIQTKESLLEVLGNQSHINSTPENYISQFEAQEQCQEFQHQQENEDLSEIMSSNTPIYEQPLTLEIHSPHDIPFEGDVQETRSHNKIIKDRSQPRQWKNTNTTHDIPVFDQRFKPKVSDTHKTPPLTVFERFFPDKLILILVEQTNRYALQKNSLNWIPVTEKDIKAYLGILILMGLNPLPDMELYWSSDKFYHNKEIAEVFPLVRFKKIMENLHINDNTMEPPRGSPDHDKLFKVRPFISELNKVYLKEAYNSQVQSVDECMVKFKGRSSIKQYMPKKPIKRGFKVWARCDSKTGYLYQFEIYTGKGDNVENEGLGYNVVMKLCANVPRNTLVAFDNFFTSCKLMEDLFEKGIYAVGTVRSNRKDLPDIMKNKLPKSLKLQKHQFASVTAEPISAIKWFDTKEVSVLTTAHKPLDIMFINRTQKDGSKQKVLCPTAIADYTISMGGVDLFDHFRSSYPISRKSRKFWMRLLFFFFDASIINAYITYKCTHVMTLHSHRDFRLRLARALINNYTTRKLSTVNTHFKNKKGGQFGVPDEIRLLEVGIHMPEETPTYKRCRFCSTTKKEQRSKIQCSTCKVSLCAKTCFKMFHTVEQ